MKFTKTCPKCQSANILRIPGTRQSHGYGNNVKVGMTLFSAVLVTKYLCCNCGFTEEWVDSLQDIEKVTQYYAEKTK